MTAPCCSGTPAHLLAQADSLAVKFHARGRKQARDHPARRDRQRGRRTAADAAARFSQAAAGRHGETDRGQDDPPAAAADLRPARPRAWCVRRRNRTSGSSFCFCCTRRRWSPYRIAIRSPRANGVRIADLAEQPLIVPERRSRPHSHDLTMKLFAAGRAAGARRRSWPMKSRPSSIWSPPNSASPSFPDGRPAWPRAASATSRSRRPT